MPQANAVSDLMQKNMFMDKLIANLAARFPDLTDEDIALSVDTIINAMSARLMSGGRIELRGFGSFSLNAQIAGTCSNPMLDSDEAGTQSAVIFKPGQNIRARINDAA